MDVSAMELAMLRNMIIKTGKPLKKWIEIVKEQNFVERKEVVRFLKDEYSCLLYTSPSPRDRQKSRMPSSA